jgi:peptidoglycan/xylan/chitin deacetylase (PgdA/CDA1 family)
MIPTRTPFILPLIYPSLIWRMPADEKVLYLTFDDGPVPGPTEYALEVLQNASANATFFCIGDNVRKHPEVFNKILAGGNTVGNHTYNHLNGWQTSLTDYVANIDQCESEMVKNFFGNNDQTYLFRPPYGRIKKNQIAALNRYSIVMWDVLTHDYNQRLSHESCLKNAIRATRNGSIIVFHDSLKAQQNMFYTLPRFINHFQNKGFVFKSISL